MHSGHRLGAYLLLDLLKRGGMAEIYRGRELATNRMVAIKVLPPALAADPDYVARFKNEVIQVRKLANPNIVPIESFGEEGSYFYFVMPLLDGSLRDALIRQERLAPLAALRVAIQIASALTAVHALGLIHRDIKPDNILLSEDGAVYLIDFDRAELRKPGIWSDGNLVRLRRSLEKVAGGMAPERFGESDWHGLLDGYRQPSGKSELPP
jgi:serine/threonine-protein kinase